MKILFGIPDLTHRELADLEISGIKELMPDCHTIHYGPVNSKGSLSIKIFNTFKNAITIRRKLIRDHYDLLFLNSTFDFNGVIRDSITWLILRLTKVKIFLKFHGSDPDLLFTSNLIKKSLSMWLIKRIDGIGVLSSEEKCIYVEKGYPLEKIFIIKNPVNPDLYKTDLNFKKSKGLNEDTFIFLFCARFLPFKGVLDVLEAVKMIILNYKDFHLICIGDGQEMGKAQLFVNDNDLTDFVSFKGFIPEVETYAYYSNVDALVFPSSHEGFPMAVFQSLAAGIPIITTKIAAAADYLREPDNVLWVDYHNPVQIANAMSKLLLDKNLVATMKKNNKEKAIQFTTRKNALEYANVFMSITGRQY